MFQVFAPMNANQMGIVFFRETLHFVQRELSAREKATAEKSLPVI